MTRLGIGQFMGFFIWISSSAWAQTQEDFISKYTAVFMNQQDSVKAKEIAMEAYEMLENTEDLQTVANYYTLRAAFDAIKDEEMVKVCEARAKAKMVFPTVVEKPDTYQNPSMEWAYEYQVAFYKSNDLTLGRKALKFLKENPELVNFTNYSAIAYFFERNMDFERAEEIYTLAFDHIDYEQREFVSLILPAFFYMRIGQYEKVEECLKLNEELLAEADQYARPGYESSGEMIQMYYYLYVGDYHRYIRSAATYYEKLYEQNKADLIGNPYASIVELNQAIGYEYLREYDKAEAHYRDAQLANEQWLKTMKATYPNYHQESFPMLDLYLAKRGDLRDRESKIARLEKYYEFIGSSMSLTPTQYYQQAMQYAFYHKEGYIDMFDEVINQILGTRDFNEATGPMAQYAYFRMRERELSKAEKMYDQLFEENLEWINDLIFTFGEKAFVAYYTTKLREGYQNYHSFVKLSADNPSLHHRLAGNAYDNLLLTKSIAFKGIRKRKQAFNKANDPEIIKLYDEWLAKKQQLISLYQRSQQDKKDLASALNIAQDTTSVAFSVSKDRLDSLKRAIDQLENRLATSAVNFKETLEIDQPRWQSVRQSLKAGEAAIELIRFHWRDQIYYTDTAYYAAYILRHDSEYPEVVYLDSFADELDTRYYKSYRNSIDLKIDDNISYDRYWKPLKSKLDGINKVYFSPDGIYHLINMPTLKNPETGTYLLEEIDLINVTSTQNIHVDEEKASLVSAVLVGRPQYSSQSTRPELETLQARSFSKDFRNANIADLPGTEDEVTAITSNLESAGVRVKQLLGPRATEDELYALKSPDILHIATHGFWSGTENATPGYRMFNAMMNSGLLMAGVVDYYSSDILAATTDGILTAYEAQNLELEGTDLVVLSACETGLGDFDAGEGVYGLQRAFGTAGAKSLITTLWKVDDIGTRDFMITFYQQMVLLNDKQEAFRKAQLTIKEKYKDPYYWGAFVLTR